MAGFVSAQGNLPQCTQNPVTQYGTKLNTWAQIGNDIDGEAAGDQSGYSVSLSSDGSIVAIGAIENTGNGDDSGYVKIFEFNSTLSNWTQIGNDIDGDAAGDLSGFSVSLSSDGTIVAIGAGRNNGNGENSGHVRIYEFNTTLSNWTQIGNDIDGDAQNDESGTSVSLSSNGTTVAIGAINNDGNGLSSGHVKIYKFNLTLSNWTQIGDDIDGEAAYDYSGWSVSLSSDGSIVAIGAIENNGNGLSSGHVKIYKFNTTLSNWTQIGNDIDGAAGDRSGISVSLSSDGSIVAIGAIGDDGPVQISVGHVKIYKFNSTLSNWTQIGDDIDGEATGDESGFSVSLSNDGTIVAIAAPLNDAGDEDDYDIILGVTTGTGRKGHVRIFQWNNESWTQVGIDIDGENHFDLSGKSVSLSGDGTRVLIGAPYNDGNGVFSGHARVFDLCFSCDPIMYSYLYILDASDAWHQNSTTAELEYCHISNWDVSGITKMDSLFSSVSFNEPLRNWNVSVCTDFNEMFINAMSFDQDLSSWNVNLTADIIDMFSNSGMSCTNIQKAANSWNRAIGDFSDTHDHCIPQTHIIDNWNLENAPYDDLVLVVGSTVYFTV